MTRSPLPPIRPREPMTNLPGVVLACAVALLAVHALRVLILPDATDLTLLIEGAFIPARWTVFLDPGALSDALREAGGGSGEDVPRVAFAQYVLTGAEAKPWTVLSHAALHGSWGHVLLNSVWLAAFGAPVARRCGAGRFLLLAALAAVGGAAAHLLAHPLSVAPMIGASGAVSGMMAASVRFAFGPEDGSDVAARPRLRLLDILRNRQAAMFVGVWFVTNLAFGLAAQPLGITERGVAWEAHMGGFLVGLLAFPLLDPGPSARSVGVGAPDGPPT